MCAVVCRVQVNWDGVTYQPGRYLHVPVEFGKLLVETKRARFLETSDYEILAAREREKYYLPIDG